MFEENRDKLKSMSNEDVAKFTAKLCPEIDSKWILGIRIPELRKFAKSIARSNESQDLILEYTKIKKNKYLEEIILEGLVIGYSKITLEQKLKHMKKYIPQINNWLTNDTVCSTFKIKNDNERKVLWNFITPYLNSSNQFEVRFAVVIMLGNFITKDYVDDVITALDKIKCNEYYAEMAIAWTLAEVGIKFNDKAMAYLRGQNHLSKFTYNKTLQKMCESYRISNGQKAELKAMKIV